MEIIVRKELDILLQMMETWKQDYISLAAPGHDHLVKDFRKEVKQHVYPYARRLLECKYVTPEEIGLFLLACEEKVLEFEEELKKISAVNPREEMYRLYGA
jgi:hypothetical protein